MATSIPSVRPDFVRVETTPRPTPTPARVHFSEVLAGGARAFVRGAQDAMRALPGGPLMAAAIRGAGGSGVLPSAVTRVGLGGPAGGVSAAPGIMPEGPGGTGLGLGGVGASLGVGVDAAAASNGSGLEGSLAQAQELSLYYLQIQEEVNAQNRTFTALSNVLEVEHNTSKSAIGNIH